MAKKELATYLNNHLSASVAALELLSSLEASQDRSDIARFAAELHAEIEIERQALEKLMEQLDITKTMPGRAIGWLAEKFTQIKLQWDSSGNSSLGLLESFELLLLGIEGKRGLWSALAATAIPGLSVADYEQFARRSVDQQQRVEIMRLAAAKAAFIEE